MTSENRLHAFSVPQLSLPPAEIRNHDDATYVDSARYNISRIAQVARLSPAMRVVDIGCAAGRLSLPLLTFLDAKMGGSYVGFDVNPSGPAWASDNITPHFPNFRYHHVDVHNDYMNGGGRTQPQDFQFPVQSDWADLVILHSVFTHMREAGIRGYTREIVRMLRPGGYLYFTLFLFDGEAKLQSDKGTAAWKFPHQEAGVYLHRLDKPEWAVAVGEPLFSSLGSDYRLQLQQLIRGDWRKGNPGGQDIAFFKKDA